MANVDRKRSKVWDEVIEGLRQFKETLDSGQKLEDRFPVRTVLVNIKPPAFSGAKVRKMRQRMGMSQAVFAQVLAVSPKTVELWEREGVKTPMARRLLEAIEPWWESVNRAGRPEAKAGKAAPRPRRRAG